MKQINGNGYKLIDCVAWNKWAEFAANQAHKGSAVILKQN
jgi:single-stranded DNA-binding protein